jgi:hypothetical protein
LGPRHIREYQAELFKKESVIGLGYEIGNSSGTLVLIWFIDKGKRQWDLDGLGDTDEHSSQLESMRCPTWEEKELDWRFHSSITEVFMKKAAIGFRVHSGWSVLVAVSLEKDVPTVLRRQRVQLVGTFSYKFRQPYHTAEKMRFEDAGKFISGVRTEAQGLANRVLRSVQVDLKRKGYNLDRGGLLLASGRLLPELEKILHSHALIHTADGELFRDVLRSAGARCGLKIMCTKERELLDHCAKVFCCHPEGLLQRVTELGRPIGSPWSQDEKFATLAAWLVLSDSQERRSKAQSATHPSADD